VERKRLSGHWQIASGWPYASAPTRSRATDRPRSAHGRGMNGEFFVLYVELDGDRTESRRRALEPISSLRKRGRAGGPPERLERPGDHAEYISKNRITRSSLAGRHQGLEAVLYYRALGKFMWKLRTWMCTS